MDEDKLIDRIGGGITRYDLWTIGITNDLARRKKDHRRDGKDVTKWHEYEADTLRVARNVEKHFRDKGMDGGLGGNVDENKTVYVYIF